MEKSKQSISLNKSTKEIIKLVSEVASNSYGVVDIAKKDEINLISKITKKGKMEDGIFVTVRADFPDNIKSAFEKSDSNLQFVSITINNWCATLGKTS